MNRVVLLLLCCTAPAAFAQSYSSSGESKTVTGTSAESRISDWRRQGWRLAFIVDNDHDKDGRVSHAEFEQSRRSRFDITDTDGNSIVDEEEYMYEWEDRMDAQLEKDREGRVRQTYVRFDAMDRDDDAWMSWEEYAASGDRIFTGWDTNDDLVIDANDPPRNMNWERTPDSELTAEERQQRRERLIAYSRSMLEMPTTHNREGVLYRYDRNNDGRVERAEFDAGRRADYNGTDFDGNGKLDADEYSSEFEDRMDAVIEDFRVGSIKQSQRRFQALDDNGDGEMTFAEYQDSGNQRFARYDISGDGFVDEDDPMPPPFRETVEQQVTSTN
ncbi:MAG: hypothetical protein AAGA61_01705 [Pseudomonadota bacterium]